MSGSFHDPCISGNTASLLRCSQSYESSMNAANRAGSNLDLTGCLNPSFNGQGGSGSRLFNFVRGLLEHKIVEA